MTNEEGLAITVVVALICILAAVIMGCGASSPPGAKYAESPPIKGDDLITSYTERIRESDLRKAQWDTFVSAAPAETALAKRVRDHLRAAGYKIPNPRKEPDAQKQGIRDEAQKQPRRAKRRNGRQSCPHVNVRIGSRRHDRVTRGYAVAGRWRVTPGSPRCFEPVCALGAATS